MRCVGGGVREERYGMRVRDKGQGVRDKEER